MVIEETRDIALLASFFRTDPARYAYQLGDLDPLFFPASRWWITQHGPPTSCLLLYTGFETAVIQAITDNDDQGLLWESLLPRLPDRALVHYLARHESIIQKRYQVHREGTHQRMQWNGSLANPDRPGISHHRVRILNEGDRHQIRGLYQAAYPVAHFDERTLQRGRTTGAFVEDQLVAIATCHVYSPCFSLAAIGAVATHPAYRGQGFCTAVMTEILRLLSMDVATIVLNVHCQNTTAISVYERLGFEHRYFYEEAALAAP
jgi:ribosomal protein S18 acetylase RimI-like enzyme